MAEIMEDISAYLKDGTVIRHENLRQRNDSSKHNDQDSIEPWQDHEQAAPASQSRQYRDQDSIVLGSAPASIAAQHYDKDSIQS